MAAGVLCLNGMVALAQERELPIDRLPSKLSGVRIRSAWIGAGKYDLKTPTSGGIVKDNLYLGSVGAALNWTNNSERMNSWANYAGEFNRTSKSSDLDSVNHGFDFGVFRHLAPRWTWRASGEGEFLNFGSRVFRFPGSTRTLRTGESAATQVGGPLLGDPSQVGFSRGVGDAAALLVGGDYYRLGATTGVSFMKSARTSWGFSGSGSQTTYKSQNNSSSAFLPLRRVHDASGSAGFRYSLNPRTVLNWETGGGRTWAGFSSTGQEQFNRGQSTLQIARTFSTHWYGSAGGGASASEAFTTTQGAPWFVTYLATAGLGYVRNDQALLVNVTHSAGDGYGFGSQENLQSTFTYTYRPVGSAWGFNGAAVYQRLKLSALPTVDGWVGMAGLTRRITRHTFLLFEAAQTSNIAFTAGRLLPVGSSRNTLDSLAQRAVRVSFVYQPMLAVNR